MVTSNKVFVEKLNVLIDENLDSPAFSIDVICEKSGISRSQLYRILKEQTGLSTSLYIRKRRLIKAKQLLTESDLRISEIADLVGINNPQNLSTYFIEEFGLSPTEFRKKQYESTESLTPESTLVQPEDKVPTGEKKNHNKERFMPIVFSNWRKVAIVGLSILFLLTISAGFHRWFWPKPIEVNGNSLAILPFINLGTIDDSHVSEGIMDNVHTSISLIPNLKVISRSSSEQYYPTTKSIWQIGDELNVAHVLKGSVLKIGDQIQIKVEVINTREDIQEWTKKYTADYKDLFQLTDQIVLDVANHLNLKLSTSASEKLGLARKKNINAYNALLQARQLQVSRRHSDLIASLTRLDQAIALDSVFAEAYALKAVAYNLLIGYDKIDARQLNRLIEENAMKAIQLDPTNSTAYGVLGSLYYSGYQWQASENSFRIALQHNPNDAQITHWYGLLMRTKGDLNKAIQLSTRAISLDPLHPIATGAHILNCSLNNQFKLAQESLQSGKDLFERSFSYQIAQAYYWLCQNNYDLAILNFQKAQLLNPDDNGQVPLLMFCEAKLGNHQKVFKYLQTLKKTGTPRADFERAVVFAGLSQADSSMHYLQKSANGGYFYRDTKVLPVFRPYHSHPTYKAILRRFDLAE